LAQDLLKTVSLDCGMNYICCVDVKKSYLNIYPGEQKKISIRQCF
jgi:hypothetical protein